MSLSTRRSLTSCFTAHFPEHRKNRAEWLALVVFALLQTKDVRHAAIAARFPGHAQTDLVIRRLERFFDQHLLCPADVAWLVLLLLPDARPRAVEDERTRSWAEQTPMRTPARNWKLGQQDVHVLLPAAVWRDVAVPLLFELLPPWDIRTRLRLPDNALELSSCAQVQVLSADREFIDQE